MADAEKDKAAEKQAADKAKSSAAKPKSDLLMYIIVGVGALVVTMGVMLGMVSGGPGPGASGSAEENSGNLAEREAQPEPETPDIFSELDDLSFLADTNFAELSGSPEQKKRSVSATQRQGHKPGRAQSSGSERGQAGVATTSADDSLSALNWLATEKEKLKVRNKALDEKANRLEALERSVNQKLTKVDQAEAARLSGLAKLYNGMKPEKVARMMVKLDDKMIVAILPRMKSAQAAKILGLMPPARGAKISKEMITLSAK